MALSKKEKVTALLKSLETKDPAPIAYVNANKYIQHNLMVEDGLQGVGKLIAQLPDSTKVNVVRAFEDGDFVFTHMDYDFFGPKIGFDIFKFEDDKIVEHWDNLQETPPLNPSGRSSLDGAQTIEDLDKTATNKAIIEHHLDDLLNGRLNKLPDYYNGDNYIQHNYLVPDQLSGLINTITNFAKDGITLIKYSKIHKVLGEGNFVLAISEGFFKGVHAAIYDLYRIEHGKIAEHWDVIEAIPSKENQKNNNGKFNF